MEQLRTLVPLEWCFVWLSAPELDLGNKSLGGQLSPFIGNLSFLRWIFLSDNNFYGIIPNEVSFLFKLETLILANSSFSGEIPTAIGNLLKLETLHLANNHLTGQFPASIGNLSALLLLDVHYNSLSGTIPYSVGELRSLEELGLSGNSIYGMVPPPIFNIYSLTILSLALNRLDGSLPHNICYDLPKLKLFTVYSSNNFSGPLPYSLANTSNRNYFSGFKNLSFLSLSENNLGTGTGNDLHFLTSINCS
ncbi:hypothetical protein Ddye_032002 [Dipteronia dyeriana]|uniref:Disease resistance R13L4/SHOC-2-like LRR domain-containing protein n=1 Tax=Dipteronia dyeriana TaxID=168575 RepID=A0AAD9TKL2_9ROSI|nr:hypothetical protein Ddye_032002 [Dipteronia dyeriana]